MKKEIGDKSNASIKFLRQILPLPKVMREVIVTETFGIVIDEKGTLYILFNTHTLRHKYIYLSMEIA